MEPTVLENRAAVSHLLSIARDKTSDRPVFSEAINALGTLVISEALCEAPYDDSPIETPLEMAASRRIVESEVIGIPILRAGLGMEKSFHGLLPRASIFHLGLKRDEKTFEPYYYYDSLPSMLNGLTAFILDPMLATGGSAIACAQKLRDLGANKIVYCGIIGAPEGVKRLQCDFPRIPIYLAALDERLDKNAYIRPGLGDAGDRLYGTYP